MMDTQSLSEASIQVKKEVRDVWLHHFRPKLFLGKEYGKEEVLSFNKKLKMIKSDVNVKVKVKELYNKWKKMENDSRRPDRAIQSSFLEKETELMDSFEIPFDIRKLDSDDTIQHCGIMDWKKEV